MLDDSAIILTDWERAQDLAPASLRCGLRGGLMGIFDDQPARTCSTCCFWSRKVAAAVPAGYLEARCLMPASPHHQRSMRGSDRCLHWERRAAAKAQASILDALGIAGGKKMRRP